MGLFQPNLYSYASNNPIAFSDPSGLSAGRTNIFGPPDFLGFDSGDPFFDFPGSSGSLSTSRAGAAIGALRTIGSGLLLVGAGFVPFVGDALDAFDVVNPSSSAFDRFIGSASLAANGLTGLLAPNAGPIVRGSDDVFEGVRELSRTLIDAGVSREDRLTVIQSFRNFDRGGIQVGRATGDESFIRFFGGEAQERGRFLGRGFPPSGGAREFFALPPGNTASGLRVFGLDPDTTFFSGAAARNFGFEGTGAQVFVPDLRALR